MAKNRAATVTVDAPGFWDRPMLIDLVADLLIGFAVLLLVWAGIVLFQRLPLFPLREVRVVTAPVQVTPGQIEHVARVATVGNFFTVDLESVRSGFEKLPWVRHAEVRRRWPDCLELALEEHTAVARWRRAEQGGSEEARLVNMYGEVFAAASEDDLPIFAGPEGSAALVLARYREFTQALSPLGRRPQLVSLSQREAWQLRLDNGLILELGHDEAKHPLAERMNRFVKYYRPALEKTRIASGGVVDMRYPNGFALRVASKS